MRFADLAESHHAVLASRKFVIRNAPSDTDNLRHGIFESGEGLGECVPVSARRSLRIELLYEMGKVMPFDLDVVFALKPLGKLVKRDLVVLRDDRADFRNEVLFLVFEYGGHGRMR